MAFWRFTLVGIPWYTNCFIDLKMMEQIKVKKYYVLETVVKHHYTPDFFPQQ